MTRHYFGLILLAKPSHMDELKVKQGRKMGEGVTCLHGKNSKVRCKEYEYQGWQKILGPIMQSAQGGKIGTQVSLEDYGAGVQLPATKTPHRAATMAEMSRRMSRGQTRKRHSPAGDAVKANRAWKYLLVGLKTSDSRGAGEEV